MRACLSLTAALCLLAASAAGVRAGEGREVKIGLSDFNWRKYVGFSEWQGMYAGDKKYGYQHVRITAVRRDGKELVRIAVRVYLKVKAMGRTDEMRMRDTREYSAEDGRLLALDMAMSTAAFDMRMKARPEGDKLVCNLVVAEVSKELSLPLPGENLFSTLAPHALIDRADAAVGDRIESEIFAPISRSSFRTVTIIRKKTATVLRGVPTTVFDLEVQRFAPPKPGELPDSNAAPDAIETVTIDSTGRMLKGTAMGKFTFRRESEEDAKRMDEVSDIMLATAISLGGRIPDARKSRKAVLKLTGMPESAMINDSRQSFTKQDGGYLLTLVAPAGEMHPALAGALFVGALLGIVTLATGGLMLLGSRTGEDSARGRRSALATMISGAALTLAAGAFLFSGWTGESGEAVELSPGERAGYLAATAFLQSDDPRIRELAADTVGSERDAYKAARLLNAWVFANIKKEFVPIASNALDTLNSRKGDCGEHAALFVALCRAARIPAREAVGLAYTDAGGGILGGHAWGEVYVDGRWLAMDPTFGQDNADALHIKVAEGGMSDMGGMLRLAEMMGKLKVEVISVE